MFDEFQTVHRLLSKSSSADGHDDWNTEALVTPLIAHTVISMYYYTRPSNFSKIVSFVEKLRYSD
jgi:hypothetical protein